MKIKNWIVKCLIVAKDILMGNYPKETGVKIIDIFSVMIATTKKLPRGALTSIVALNQLSFLLFSLLNCGKSTLNFSSRSQGNGELCVRSANATKEPHSKVVPVIKKPNHDEVNL